MTDLGRLPNGDSTAEPLVQVALSAESPEQRLPAVGTERIQGQSAALLKITQEIQVACRPAMVVSAGNQVAVAPASCCTCKEGIRRQVGAPPSQS
jgi:hypothetical protein